MDLRVNEFKDKRIIEGPAGKPLLVRVAEITQLVEACFNQSTKLLLLYAENLTGGFFDLSSLEAGEILQRLRTYKIRLAVVLPRDTRRKLSSAFHDLLLEESRGIYFRLFEDRKKAESWLLEE